MHVSRNSKQLRQMPQSSWDNIRRSEENDNPHPRLTWHSGDLKE
jgi:hypothetical protein